MNVIKVILEKRIKGTDIILQKVEATGKDDFFRVLRGCRVIATHIDLNESYKIALEESGLLEIV